MSRMFQVLDRGPQEAEHEENHETHQDDSHQWNSSELNLTRRGSPVGNGPFPWKLYRFPKPHFSPPYILNQSFSGLCMEILWSRRT